MDFVKFLIHDNLCGLYTCRLRYNIWSTWFSDIRISTFFLTLSTSILISNDDDVAGQ